MIGPAADNRSGPVSRDDWARLEPLLDALLDTPHHRRAALLAELSGGDPLRREELERLVAECEQEYPLIERSVGNRFGSLFKDDDRVMPRALAERFQQVRELGRGGMATVYLARDVKHAREVAVKVIRSDVAATLGVERFLREIEIVAQLQHPHIVPLFDSGRVPTGSGQDALYYVMPYLEGRSLRERLAREHRLGVEETVTILRDVCDALAHAHGRGIVHRDIKPDNVLLSGRHASVSDFGIARAISAAVGPSRTGAGVLVGTPTYMAPEQATGDPNVDHRADIYALGVLAYEMLTGQPPFTGTAHQEIVSAHLVDTPVPLTIRRPDVPLALADLVMGCLAKRPSDRWQSADELLARLGSLGPSTTPTDLLQPATTGSLRATPATLPRVTTIRHPYRWLGAAALGAAALLVWALRPEPRARLATPAPAVAVLVFQHEGTSESESLALGVTSELIGALGSITRIDVRSLAAVLPYRDRRTEVDSIARRLNVRWLVDGRVTVRGDSVVVTAELSDAPTGRFIASRDTRAASNDHVRLIERLVPAVATMLRERIGDEVRLEGWRAGTHSEAAFTAVNRAHQATLDADHLAGTRDLTGAWQSLRRADSALATAARADPAWIEPLVQRAWVARKIAFLLVGNGVTRESVLVALRRGVEQADVARRASPHDPRALEAKGVLAYSQWLIGGDAAREGDADSLLAAAEALLTEATDADASLARGLNILGFLHFRRGDFERARLAMSRAYAADAYAQDAEQVLMSLFNYNFADGRDEEARSWCEAYGRTFTSGEFYHRCRLHLMAWDPNANPNADSAWSFARAGTAATPESIRALVAPQFEVLAIAVLARVGAADSARRALSGLNARIRAEPAAMREPFGRQLLELQAGVRVLLGEPTEAIALLSETLKARPDRRASLARDRRFRGLPPSELMDSPARPR